MVYFMEKEYQKDKKIALKIIKKFLQRQKFALKLLKNDPEIEEHPKFGFLHACGDIGKISNKKEWEHYFHGVGVRLTNKKTEEVIDFDFGFYGEIGEFDSGWLCNYVQCEIRRLALHPRIYLDFVFIRVWQSLLERFADEGLIKQERKNGLSFLTEKGQGLLQK